MDASTASWTRSWMNWNWFLFSTSSPSRSAGLRTSKVSSSDTPRIAAMSAGEKVLPMQAQYLSISINSDGSFSILELNKATTVVGMRVSRILFTSHRHCPPRQGGGGFRRGGRTGFR